jgi:hypothetical protein
MEQTNQCAGLGVKTSGIRTFSSIAVRTSQSEIFGYRISLMLPGSNVIHLKAQR